MSDKQNLRRILKAIRCCREDLCEKCPMQGEICDEFGTESEPLPAALVDMIEDELEEKLKVK